MIEVKNLTKYYGDKPGVQDVNFTIATGEIVGLLGPNGAGKSTLMKMLTGYHMPTSGEYLIDGVSVIDDPDETLCKVGFLPEIPPLYVDMAVRDFLVFSAQVLGVDKKSLDSRVDEIMKLTSITDVSSRLIKNLSKGYRQRVGLAQALLGEPEILILDEPTVGLDPKQMADFRNLVLELGRTHTVILSSHILSEISQVCKRLIIFNNGKVVAEGSVDELEKNISGGDRFSLKLKAASEKAISIIKGVEGVSGVENMSGVASRENCCYLMVEGQGGEIREKVFDACVKADMPILEMTSEKPTLEQVFLRLVDGTAGR